MEVARRVITYVTAWGPGGGGTIGCLDGGWGPAEGSRGRALAGQLGAEVARVAGNGLLWRARPCESDYELDWEVVWGLPEAGEVRWYWWLTLCPKAVTCVGAREVELGDIVDRVCRMIAPDLAACDGAGAVDRARTGAAGASVRVLRLADREQAARRLCPRAPGLQTRAAEAALEVRIAEARVGVAARVQVWWGAHNREEGEESCIL